MTLIDDFSSGQRDLDVAPGSPMPTVVSDCQPGEMLGGARHINLRVSENPRTQAAHLDTGSGFLNLSLGAEQIARVDVEYGFAVNDGECTPVPLVETDNGNFRSKGSVIRTTFNSVSTPTGSLNFNVSVQSVEGNASAGLEVLDSATPFEVTFRFAGEGASDDEFGQEADFRQVTFVGFVFQTSGDFVIDTFEIV